MEAISFIALENVSAFIEDEHYCPCLKYEQWKAGQQKYNIKTLPKELVICYLAWPPCWEKVLNLFCNK